MLPSLSALSLSQHQGLCVCSGIKIVRYFDKKKGRKQIQYNLNKEKIRWSGLFTYFSKVTYIAKQFDCGLNEL